LLLHVREFGLEDHLQLHLAFPLSFDFLFDLRRLGADRLLASPQVVLGRCGALKTEYKTYNELRIQIRDIELKT
jgi:hypothetical protein